jgi:hypothetical protein
MLVQRHDVNNKTFALQHAAATQPRRRHAPTWYGPS